MVQLEWELGPVNEAKRRIAGIGPFFRVDLQGRAWEWKHERYSGVYCCDNYEDEGKGRGLFLAKGF